MNDLDFNLYEYPPEFTGRSKKYVSVRGHSRSVPVVYTYKGTDGYNYIRPEYGGNLDGYKDYVSSGPMIMRDITPFMSVVDNTMITSRSELRAHVAKHDLIEVGNEKIEHKPVEVGNPIGLDIKKSIEQLKARV